MNKLKKYLVPASVLLVMAAALFAIDTTMMRPEIKASASMVSNDILVTANSGCDQSTNQDCATDAPLVSNVNHRATSCQDMGTCADSVNKYSYPLYESTTTTTIPIEAPPAPPEPLVIELKLCG